MIGFIVFVGICVGICNMRFVFHIPHRISKNVKPVIGISFFSFTLGIFDPGP